MEKPVLAAIPDHMARPFVYNYCKAWGIPFDADTDFEYGQAVLWMGAFYKGGLRAVIGLMGFDEIPDDLYIYGFYGDGTPNEKRPLRGLIDFLFRFPQPNKYGFVHVKNKKMLDLWAKYGGKVIELGEDTENQLMVKVQGVKLNGRKVKPSSRGRTNSS